MRGALSRAHHMPLWCLQYKHILFQHSVYCHKEQHAEKNIWTSRRGQRDGKTTKQDEKVCHVDGGDKDKCIQNF